MKLIIFLIVTQTLSACVTANFSKTGNFNPEKKSKSCEFTVFTTKPEKPFKEVGVVSFSGNFWSGKLGGAGSIEHAKKLATEHVCKSGANAILLWEINGVGNYKQATAVYIE